MGVAKNKNTPPMPLKHFTETVLVFVLGIVFAATGIVLSTLPHLPPGILPWLLLFIATLIYPAALYPLLKNNRADYEFRALHFLPAAITLLWLLLASSMLRFPFLGRILAALTYACSLPFVLVSFVLLVWFCLRVIRRRVPRLVLLVCLFVPYLAFAISTKVYKTDEKIAAVLWHGSWWNITGVAPGLESSSGKNLAFSSFPEEEQWRQKIRQFEMGLTQTGSAVSSTSSASSRASAPLILSSSSSSSSKPSRLPSAGPETDALVLTLVGLYGGVLHHRAKKRAMQV